VSAGRKTVVYRIQARDGHGPFRPGVTVQWLVPRKGRDALPSWMDEFGVDAVLSRLTPGWYAGCACMTLAGLRRWFSEQEYKNLLELGFDAVSIDVDRVVAQSEIQLVFERKQALRHGAKVVRLYETLVAKDKRKGYFLTKAGEEEARRVAG
jgi:hypothetical protein